MYLGKLLRDKKNGVSMSDGKRALKLPGNHIDFN